MMCAMRPFESWFRSKFFTRATPHHSVEIAQSIQTNHHSRATHSRDNFLTNTPSIVRRPYFFESPAAPLAESLFEKDQGT
jgi:hypothetical protein